MTWGQCLSFNHAITSILGDATKPVDPIASDVLSNVRFQGLFAIMNLLKLNDDDTTGISLHTFSRDAIPPYDMFSYTWGRENEEVSFSDIKEKTGSTKVGFKSYFSVDIRQSLII
jgi:hypothetical protein